MFRKLTIHCTILIPSAPFTEVRDRLSKTDWADAFADATPIEAKLVAKFALDRLLRGDHDLSITYPHSHLRKRYVHNLSAPIKRFQLNLQKVEGPQFDGWGESWNFEEILPKNLQDRNNTVRMISGKSVTRVHPYPSQS